MRKFAAIALLCTYPAFATPRLLTVNGKPLTAGSSARLSTTAGLPFAVAKNYDYSTPTTKAVVIAYFRAHATAGDLLCGVGLGTGHASNWECIDATGSQVCAAGTTNPGTATVTTDATTGLKALKITAAAQAPNIVCPAMDAIYSGDAARSTIVYGHGDAAGRVSGLNVFFWGYAGGANCYFQFYNAVSGNAEGVPPGFTVSSMFPGVGASGSLESGWGVAIAAASGVVGGIDGESELDVNGANTRGVMSAGYACPAGAPGPTHWTFGGSGTTYTLNGELGLTGHFNHKLTTTERREWRDILDGFGGSRAGPTTYQSTLTVQGEYIDNTATTGRVDRRWTLNQLRDTIYGGLRAVHSRKANGCPTDNTALETCTLTGGATVDTNVASGPFANIKGGAEEDRLNDSSAAAFGCAQTEEIFGTHDGGSQFFTVSGFVRQDTVSTARISFNTDAVAILQPDGGTTGVCDFTLSSSSQRLECTAKLTGETTAKGRLCVGNAVSATGAVIVSEFQGVAGQNVEPPSVETTQRGAFGYTLDPVADGWNSPALGGAIEIVSTPLWDSDQFAGGFNPGEGTYYEFDAFLSTGTPSADHTIVIVYNYDGTGRLLVGFRTGNVGGGRDLSISGITRRKGVRDVTRAEWRALGGGKCTLHAFHDTCASTPAASCHATTSVGEYLVGDADCPGTPDTIRLCNRLNGVAETSCVFERLTLYAPPFAWVNDTPREFFAFVGAPPPLRRMKAGGRHVFS